MGEMIQVAADQPLNCYLAKPDGEPKGAVIVIHEVWGLVDHIKSVADRFAREGYVALAPDLMFEVDFSNVNVSELQKQLFDPKSRADAQPKLRQLMAPMQDPSFGEKTTNRLKACFDFLYEMPDVKQNVVIVGFCFGGTYSYSLAVNEPRLKIAFPFYGHADMPVSELAKIKCPIRAFYGQEDERLIESLDDLKQKMKEANVDYKAKVYEGCGHAFFNDSNPYTYNEEASNDAWGIVKEELSK